MATNNRYNIDAVNAVLQEILEGIVVGIMDSVYDDETDEYLENFIFSLLSAIDTGTTAESADEETPAESQPGALNPIPEAAEEKEESEEIFEESIYLPGADGLPSSDAPFSATELELAPILETALLGDLSGQDQEEDLSDIADESIAPASRITSSRGDVPSSELGPDDPTSTPEKGPLGDVVLRSTDASLDERVLPASGIEVKNSFGELIGWLDPSAAAPRPRTKPGKWKSVRRFFRRLCCCCR